MALCGISAAFERLTALYTSCDQAKDRVVLVDGGMAVGKTELLHVFSEHVRENGGLLLNATGARAERTLRMGLIRQLCGSGRLPPETSARLSRLIRADDQPGGDPEARAEPAAAIGRAIDRADAELTDMLCAAVLELSADRPVVLCVDDVHFADDASLQALLYLRRRISSAAVMMVVSFWERPRNDLRAFCAEITRFPHEWVRLRSLNRDEVADLVNRRIDQADTRTADLCYAMSGGNPLLVDALVDDHLKEATADYPQFAGAALSCLYRWEAAILDVARAVAVFGDHATMSYTAHLTGLDEETVDESLSVLTGAGLLDGMRWRHMGMADTVLADIPPETLGQLNAEAAQTLHRDGACARVIAEFLVKAGTAQALWAVEALRTAAKEALRENNAPAAARYLELALRHGADVQDRLPIAMALARLEWPVDPAAAKLRLAPWRRAIVGGHLAGADVVTALRTLLWFGDGDSAAKALTALGGSLEPGAAAGVRSMSHLVYGSPDRLLPLGEDAGALAADSRLNTTKVLGTALTARPSVDITGAADFHLRGDLHDSTAESVVVALLALIHTGHTGQAAAACARLLVQARTRGSTTFLALLECVQAEIALLHGDLPGAAEGARTALDRLDARGWGVFIGYPLSIAVQAETAMHRYENAAELLQRAVPEAMRRTVFGLRYLYARGLFTLHAGRTPQAVNDLERCGRLMREWRIDAPAFIPWRGALAEAHMKLHRPQIAHELLTRQLALTPPAASRTRGVTLRLLASVSRRNERPRILRQALEQLRASGDRFEVARALFDFSRACTEIGDVAQARLADQQVERLGLTAARDPGEAPLKKGTRRRTASLLSEAERRVATLAARGRTNREIGRELYITVSTVEQHLTRVYRKLQVRSRTDLHLGLFLDPKAANPGT
ncbi:AAA family ATPase [Sinosporangium siamense]|nr:LuxR family transcriptional regulator [Sinosporangium siamense]